MAMVLFVAVLTAAVRLAVARSDSAVRENLIVMQVCFSVGMGWKSAKTVCSVGLFVVGNVLCHFQR